MLSLLSRRERCILRKFQMGYYATAFPGQATAWLYPGENVIGERERVRVSLLEHLEHLNYIAQDAAQMDIYTDNRQDITWRNRLSVARNDNSDHTKLDRHCPRCHAHRYHFGNRVEHKVTITCAECGHSWNGKFNRDEWT